MSIEKKLFFNIIYKLLIVVEGGIEYFHSLESDPKAVL